MKIEMINDRPLKVMKSKAGYYVGREYEEDGEWFPYDRITDYFDKILSKFSIENVMLNVQNFQSFILTSPNITSYDKKNHYIRRLNY